MSRAATSFTDITDFGSASSTYLVHEAHERPAFNAELLRQRYEDDPVALAMIDYIEELLRALPASSAGLSWSPWSLSWDSTGTITNTAADLKIKGWSITTSANDAITMTASYDED